MFTKKTKRKRDLLCWGVSIWRISDVVVVNFPWGEELLGRHTSVHIVSDDDQIPCIASSNAGVGNRSA